MPHSKELKAKISAGVKRARASGKCPGRPLTRGDSRAIRWTDCAKQRMSDTLRATWQFKFADVPWNDAPAVEKWRRLVAEQCGRCATCGFYEWNGKPIALEMHHVDGNNQNNAKENVSLLCPNCHAQTPNYRLLNKHKGMAPGERSKYYWKRKAASSRGRMTGSQPVDAGSIPAAATN